MHYNCKKAKNETLKRKLIRQEQYGLSCSPKSTFDKIWKRGKV